MVRELRSSSAASPSRLSRWGAKRTARARSARWHAGAVFCRQMRVRSICKTARIARAGPSEPLAPPRPSHYPASLLSQNASAPAYSTMVAILRVLRL